MEPPILRLHGDVWSIISEMLDLTSIYQLMMLGSIHLSSSLARYIKSIKHYDIGPVLDLTALLRTAHRLHSLESITVLATTPCSMVRYPVLLDSFPPKLRSLNLSLKTAYELFAGLDLAKLTPNLKDLALSGERTTSVPLSAFLLPPTLEVLSLRSHSVMVSLDPHGLAQLPQALTSLNLNITWTALFCPLWPPLLTHLQLKGVGAEFMIESLPRNLVSLDLYSLYGLGTSFPSPRKQLVFPWRVFFPRLTQLRLPHVLARDFVPSAILKSVVTTEACDIEVVNAFISSLPPGANPSNDVEMVPLPTHPTFTKLSLPGSFWTQLTEKLAIQLQAVAPYIRNTDLSLFSANDSNLKHAGAITSAGIGSTTSETEKLPSTLTRLEGALTIVKCLKLVEDSTDDPTMIDSVNFPTLSTLALYDRLSILALSCLPNTITDLRISIQDSVEWDLIVTTLVQLRNLKIGLLPLWQCPTELEAVASPHLTTFSLMSDSNVAWPSKPNYYEFFSSPSLLPPTVTDLSIIGASIDISVFAVLPRSLIHLELNGVAWTEQKPSLEKCFPEGANLVSDELIKSLPPRLRSVNLFRGYSPDKTPINPDCLQFLPNTLASFRCNKNDFELQAQESCYLKDYLPPLVSTIFCGGDMLNYTKITGTERSTT